MFQSSRLPWTGESEARLNYIVRSCLIKKKSLAEKQHCAKQATHTSFCLYSSEQMYCECTHFIDENMEAKKPKITQRRSLQQRWDFRLDRAHALPTVAFLVAALVVVHVSLTWYGQVRSPKKTSGATLYRALNAKPKSGHLQPEPFHLYLYLPCPYKIGN